ncbi:MAG: GNAT family N-acetyltransferase [Gemmatimonadota bacterium]|nr:GNAT family N-acetyltransferase [Gemmatimonadota bacterium]
MTTLAVRKARLADVPEIAALVDGYAREQKMLARSIEQVTLTLDDYLVAIDAHGRIRACGALCEYSPSVAEVASIAVARDAQGCGLGRHMVQAVESLARRRGYGDVFLITVCPTFFATLGYAVVDRALYPEKVCGHALSLAACDVCEKLCMWRAVHRVTQARDAA